jgi:hypothetical protein
MIPRSIPDGLVLCHNRVRHGRYTFCGVNGFRAWLVHKPPERFARCHCGWSGLPHYARADVANDPKTNGVTYDSSLVATERAIRKGLALYGYQLRKSANPNDNWRYRAVKADHIAGETLELQEAAGWLADLEELWGRRNRANQGRESSEAPTVTPETAR